MKELRDYYRSDSLKQGVFEVELVNDNLYEWCVRLLKVDPDSALHEDLVKLNEKAKEKAKGASNGDARSKERKPGIELAVLFKEDFPFSPPFVRVVEPVMTGGYILSGGAICMELLTKQGWSSAYSLESVFLQIAATFVKGRARVVFAQSARDVYSLAKAQAAYQSLVKIHAKSGWHTPPKDEG